MESKKTYLGDGLYAMDDGFMFWLTTQRENGENSVALEPSTFSAFLQFIERSRGVKIKVTKDEAEEESA